MSAGAALAAVASIGSAVGSAKNGKGLKLLFLGGTGFIGPHQIEYALSRGHEVTMFNRGSKPNLYGERVEELIGDRDSNKGAGLAALEGNRKWDVVIDNSGYVPRHVRDSAELLKGRTERYLFISTVAVYDYGKSKSADRDAPLLAAPEPATERVTGETYGPLKAECDRIVREIYGEQSTVVRPCYIVGPGDTSDRFTYWVERFHRGGDIVCPAWPGHEAQWIDARDLCQWVVRMAEEGTAGAWNGAGPASPVTNEQLMWALRSFASNPTRLHWPSRELLDELQYSTPMFDRARIDRHTDATASWEAGLGYRSLAETVRDTQAWWLAQSPERQARARRWPSAEAELAVLERLRG